MGRESAGRLFSMQHVRFGRINGVLGVVELAFPFLSKLIVINSCRIRSGVLGLEYKYERVESIMISLNQSIQFCSAQHQNPRSRSKVVFVEFFGELGCIILISGLLVKLTGTP